MDYRPSEVKAGIMIVVTLVAAMVMLAVLGEWDRLFTAQDVLLMEFDVVSGLEVENEVLYAGQKIGQVSRIESILVEPDPEKVERLKEAGAELAGEIRTHRIRVYAVVEGGHQFTTGDRASIDKNLTGKAIIDIRPGPGTFLEETHSGLYPDQAVYNLETQPTVTFNDITYYVRKMLEEKGEPLLDSAKKSVDHIGVLVEENREKIGRVIARAESAAEKVDVTVEALRQFVDDNRKNAGQAIEDVKSAAGDLKELTKQARGVMDQQRLETIAGKIEESATRLRSLLDDKTLERIDTITGDVADGAAELKTGAAELRGQLQSNRRTIKDIFTHVADASMFLSQGLEDLRRNPWRLFYRPKPEELADEYRFQAATALQQGSRRLNNTVQVLARMLERDDLTPEDKTEIRALLKESRRILETVRKREEVLWEKGRQPGEPAIEAP